jgi:hypothetical protein
MADSQSLKNHTRLDPLFHQFMVPIALLLLIGATYGAVTEPGWRSGLQVLAVLWAIVAMFKIRLYSLKVQDRVIRLEERVRLDHLLPESLKARIGELNEDQLIGLRFASDAELPSLVQKTLDQKFDRKQIKNEIQDWRPDNWRV